MLAYPSRAERGRGTRAPSAPRVALANRCARRRARRARVGPARRVRRARVGPSTSGPPSIARAQGSGSRAGADLSGGAGSPMCARIDWIANGSVAHATIRISPAQHGQVSGKAPPMPAGRTAPRERALPPLHIDTITAIEPARGAGERAGCAGARRPGPSRYRRRSAPERARARTLAVGLEHAVAGADVAVRVEPAPPLASARQLPHPCGLRRGSPRIPG